MVTLNRIYTRTGDDGGSALGNGERRPKSDQRFAAIGTVDEVNATVGLARLAATGATDAMLARIQNDLFDLGADLAVPEVEKRPRERLRIVDAQVARLEAEIDQMNENLAPLTSFVLPGGTPLAASLHLCRTVARRAEREMVALAALETLNEQALRYLNRLSDFFFVAARFANDGGAGDVLWVPGGNR
ncbi:MAG: cob(I)yrinic acid a,c-diamide adenosyltransferase [Rhizobiales bacterium]|nr:cob(I)yrinic acid a,c-diamide adenosyltransferase [Hyphomicrobiales bacterium]